MRRADGRKAIDRTLAALVAMLEAGQEEVQISKVVSLLGYELKAEGQMPDPPPDPRVDPITGCLPVTADPGVQ